VQTTAARPTAGAARLTRAEAREVRRAAILDAAARLFYERGVHEVGMDELVAATGLSKPAVYRVFPSKDALIGGYLTRLGDSILGLGDDDRARLSPADALHAVLEAVEVDLRRPTFRGCPFNNASVEFPDPGHPARAAARRYRSGLHGRLHLMAGEVVDDEHAARALADQLAVLIDGAYVSAVHLGPDGPASSGLRLGHRLIDEAGR
jgi:AcrR family transcriptional regulator